MINAVAVLRLTATHDQSDEIASKTTYRWIKIPTGTWHAPQNAKRPYFKFRLGTKVPLYRKRVPPAENFWQTNLFITFFKRNPCAPSNN